MTTPKFSLSELTSAQASKFAIVNENLRKSEILIMPTVVDSSTSSPPASPSDGDAHIVGSSPTGAWSTASENDIAAFINNAWTFFTPSEGWQVYDLDIGSLRIFTGSRWAVIHQMISSPSGSALSFVFQEEEITLSGASVESVVSFPNQCSVIGVTARVTEEITGASVASVRIGPTGGVATKYGSGIGLAVGSTSQGTNGSFEGNYAETTITVTPDAGSFSGGKIRVCLWYAVLTVPSM